MKIKTALLASAFMVGLTALSTAQIPYQGRLTDASGAPLTTANATVTFRLWSSQTGGSTLWGPQTIPVSLVDGRFAVKIGPTDGTNRDIVQAIEDGGLFLELRVGGDSTANALPRHEILAAPRAAIADTALRLTGELQIQSDLRNSGNQAHRIFFKEQNNSTANGFSLAYAGNPGPTLGGTTFSALPRDTFSIIRHNELTIGTPSMSISRTSGRIGLFTYSPEAPFHIASTTNAGLGNGQAALQIGNQSGPNIAFDNNEIIARNNGAATTLRINHGSGLTSIGSDALVNGKLTAADEFIVDGKATFFGQNSLEIVTATLDSPADAPFSVFKNNAVGDRYLMIDGDDIQVSDGASASTLFLNWSGGNVSIGNASSTTTVRGNFVDSSDRNLKDDIRPIDGEQILNRLTAMPLSSWKFIESDRRHIGPMAQDFHAAFDDLLDLQSDDTTIAPVDRTGVAFASIQALNKKLEKTEAENASLRQRLDKLEKALESLSK